MNTVLDAALGVSTLSLSAAPSTLPSALATPARSGSDLAEHSKALASDSGFEGSPEMAPFACPVENSPSFGASLPPTGPGSGNGALNGLGSPSLSPSLGALPVPLANGSMAVAEGGEADAEPKKKKKPLTGYSAKAVLSGTYEPERHWYPRVLNAQLHPLVGSFLTLGNERMIARFSHMNPQVRPEALASILSYKPKYFQWAGSDLFNAVNYNGRRQMIIVETNSCPSGQKSMPLLQDTNDEWGGYGVVVEHALKPLLQKTDPKMGDIAVCYDKNGMENSGYAEVLADVTQERVWLVEFYDSDPNPPVRWVDGVMHVRDQQDEWHPIRACFKYTTQKPWTRFPIQPKTVVMNSILACIAGGRNKALAARAYDFLNAELAGSGLAIHMPETIKNCSKAEIPLWVESLGGQAVIKVPYSNAGQGVYTILNQRELDDFMATDHKYEKFIVQSLVGSPSWNPNAPPRPGKFYHVGTVPDKKSRIHVCDLRMMVCANEAGFRPVAIYARKSRVPLLKSLADDPNVTSWEMLGTNLSVKLGENEWTTESNRLLLMDRKDFNQLGLGIDDLIDAYVQTVLSIVAIDKMCGKLMKAVRDDAGNPVLDKDGEPCVEFDWKLFAALCPDNVMLDEILRGNGMSK